MTTHRKTDVTTGKLVRLENTGLTVGDPREDIRGRTVIDRNGDEIGHVDALLIDDRKRNVRFLEVASGGIFGIIAQKFLVPVDAITRVGPDQVMVDQTSKQIAGAPRYDPGLTYDQGYYADLYGYYGYPPYWGAGDTSPASLNDS